MRQAVAGIELDGAFEEPRGLGSAGRVVPEQGVALEHAFVGVEARRRLPACPLRVGYVHAPDERADDRLHDLVLDREDLGLRAVESFAPDVVAGLRVDQLHADAHAVADAPHGTLDDEAHVELARDLRGIDRRNRGT